MKQNSNMQNKIKPENPMARCWQRYQELLEIHRKEVKGQEKSKQNDTDAKPKP